MKGIKRKVLAVLCTCLIGTCGFFPRIALASTSDQISSSITRIYGNDRYDTAAKIAEVGWPGTSNYAILADGLDGNLIDALTSGPLAAKLDAPILLTQGDSLNSFAQQELTRLAVKTVYITITNAEDTNLQNIIAQVKAISTVTDVEVLGGSDPAQTSVNIANEMATLGVKIDKVIVAGGNGVDALSVSPIAGAQGMPILYSGRDTLPSNVSDYLNIFKSSIDTTYIIGGTGVISNAVASQLPGSVERVAGQDQYDTNIKVLEKFSDLLKYKNTFLANGDTLVDALAVAPLAAQSGSPILLTSLSLSTLSEDYAQAYLSPEVIALGGEAVVSSNVLAKLTPQLVYTQAGTTQGSTDPNSLSQIDSPIKITGNNVTLGNADSNNCIYIQGDNDTLNNVSVQGTIFINPGATGSANLQNVSAKNIVIMSGANSSIDFNNVTADTLLVASNSNVHIRAKGTTNISATTATSSANIDNSGGGSFGPITITSSGQSDPVPSVQLTGSFTQPITVNSTANVVTASDANVSKVVVKPDNSSQTVTVQGVFTTVTVSSPCNLTLGSNTTVQTVQTNAKANITVPTSSSITNLDTNNQSVTIGGVPAVLTASAVNSSVNSTINITLSKIDQSWSSTGPTPDMFTVAQSINGGTATPVTVSKVGGSNTTYYLIVPSITSASITQNVVYYVSYKGGTPVSTNPLTNSASSSSSTLAFTSSANLTQGVVGQYYSYTFAATGGSNYGYTYSLTVPTGAASNYPDGLSLSSNGVLLGYPQSTGTWSSIPITVKDSVGNSVTGYFNLTVTTSADSSTLAFTSSTNLTQGFVGQYYSYTFAATGGSNYGYTYSLGASSNYPSGLNLSSNGVLLGYPQSTGAWSNIPITVTDSAGNSVTSYFNLTVSTSANSSTLAFTSPTNLTQGVVGQYYSYPFAATGGSNYGYTYSLTAPTGAASNYPDGLSLSSNGVLIGYPQSTGTWNNIPITVKDSAGNSVTSYFNLTVTSSANSSTLAFVSPTNLTQGVVGQYYSYPFAATGGSNYGYTYSLGVSSNYPSGLNLSSNGVLIGYPQSTGTWSSIPVTVTDSVGNSVTGYFNLTVTTSASGSILTFASPTNLPQGTVGQYYSYTFTATGGSNYGYTYSLTIPTGAASNYPDGLSLSSNGVLIGYPQSTGTWSSIQITVTDSKGSSARKYFTLIVK